MTEETTKKVWTKPEVTSLSVNKDTEFNPGMGYDGTDVAS